MQKERFEFIVDGYGSGEIDFMTRLNQDGIMRQVFIDTIITPIVEVLNLAPDVGAVLTVAGHSDRVDTGAVHAVALAQETQASEARTDSAISGIHTLVQQFAPGAPSDLNLLDFFFVFPRTCGASVLLHDGAGLSEAQRRQNRRVQVRLVRFSG